MNIVEARPPRAGRRDRIWYAVVMIPYHDDTRQLTPSKDGPAAARASQGSFPHEARTGGGLSRRRAGSDGAPCWQRVSEALVARHAVLRSGPARTQRITVPAGQSGGRRQLAGSTEATTGLPADLPRLRNQGAYAAV